MARALYGAAMARACAAGHERVVFEVNVEPANEGSLRLHEWMGFRAVGTDRRWWGNEWFTWSWDWGRRRGPVGARDPVVGRR